MRRIRILFLVNGFSVGGGEKKLLELVRVLQTRYRDAFHVVVCSVGQGGPLQADFERTGARTVVYRKCGKYDVSLAVKVARLMREERIDVLQSTLFYADVIGALAAKWIGLENILFWDANTQENAFKHVLAYRVAGKWARRVIAVSGALRESIIRERHLSESKVRVVHYGIDLETYAYRERSSLRDELELRRSDPVIGTVARLGYEKNQGDLLVAAAGIRKTFPKAHVVLAGDGPERSALEARAGELGLGHNVHFLGFRRDVRNILNGLDVFVLPSLYEGFPNAVLEAMACGLPVVATNVGGTSEAVIHGCTGLLVPPSDPPALEEALGALLANPALRRRMGREGLKRVKRFFPLEKQIRNLIELYQVSAVSRRS